MAPEDAKPHWEEFYLGSRRFQYVADTLGMPIDQVNFILGQVAGLVLAWVMRVYLHPARVSTTTRHWWSFLAGLGISYFCFGRQVLFAVALVLGCYLLMLVLPITLLHHATLAASLTFLSVMHIQRQFYEDGMFVIDVTGPLMIMVQKATSLAYSLHDGLSGIKDHDLTPLQREMVQRRKPSAIEYFGYMLNFHSMLAGPFFMFADYQDFVEGTNYAKRALNVFSGAKTSLDSNRNKNVEEEEEVVVAGKGGGHVEGVGVGVEAVPAHHHHPAAAPASEPNPTRVSLYKASLAAGCAFVTVVILPRFPVSYVTEPAFFQHSYLYKAFFLVAVTSLTRHVYYTAWLLGDGICNMSGIGYNGRAADGSHRWDGVSNVDVVAVESALSLRNTLEAWNSGTMKWLRFMVYERATMQKTLFTYMLSSMWHGFYPGYYITFVSGAYFTIAARYVRRTVRPRVVAAGARAKVAYDILTCITTRLCLAFFTFPFILLRFWGSIAVYRDFYFVPYIVGGLFIVVLPFVVLPPPTPRKEASGDNSIINSSTEEKKAQ